MDISKKYIKQSLKLKVVEVQYISDEDVKTIFKALEPGGLKNSTVEKRRKIADNEEETLSVAQDKPSSLFEKGDVAGQQLFGFQTPKRQNALANKSVQSPEVVKTPVRKRIIDQSAVQFSPKLNKSATKVKSYVTPNKAQSVVGREKKLEATCQTPYNLRRRLKSKLSCIQSDESEDFSASESEYEESSSDESSESNSDSEDEKENTPVKKILLSEKEGRSAPNKKKNKLNFVPEVEEYFHSHASKKVLTSNRTLGKLRYQLPHEKLNEILSNVNFGHEDFFKKLHSETSFLFKKWRFLLSEGFNILVYGVGSKRNILNSFLKLINDPCIVVNGFFPSLSIQEIVSSIAQDVLQINITAADLLETVDYIKNMFSQYQSKLYIIVHNIDGIMLRNDKSQEVLASLSSAHNIHLIASIDHVSAALMWDQNMLSMYDFHWCDLTTYEPYTEETAFESSLLVQQSGNLALSSLQSVFRSLTSNAKNIFLLMAEYQRENKKESHYNGMPFKKLYSLCRESLLVSSDLALRSQLTEFLDHKLVKSRRGADGSELLLIPIESTILDQFVNQQGD